MLTKRQKQVLDFIKDYDTKNELAPSLEEIKKHLGLNSVSTAHHHVEALRKDGYLNKENNRPRSIDALQHNKSILIPIVGNITAGQPLEAFEYSGQSVAVAKDELNDVDNLFALLVKGESMLEEGILDGDTVIIRKQSVCRDGESAVAVINGNEATLKKIYKEKGGYRLQPANQLMLPIHTKNLEIRGVVVKVIRNVSDKKNSTLSELEFAEKKEKFLSSIRRENGTYKRVIVSPLRYAGGKSLAVGFIVNLFPNNIKRIISPFFGGGSLEIACNKFLGLDVVGYDIFDILMNYWKFQVNDPETLYQELKKLKPTAEEYVRVKDELKKVWKKEGKLPPLQLAAYYYFNHNLSYGPGFLGWASKVYLNQKRYDVMIEKVRKFSVKNFKVFTGDFEEAFKKYPNDFFYCDPPYYLDGDSKMFRGIYPMRNIPVHHNGFDHEKLLNLLRNHKGGFVLSYNNCETIRNWYKDFDLSYPEWQYTMGQGETRIGLNRINNGKLDNIKESHELLIYGPPKI